jgi:hypothetical protein
MNTTLEYSTRVVQEGDRRCKKSTLNDLAYLTPLRIPLMNPVTGSWDLTGVTVHAATILGGLQIALKKAWLLGEIARIPTKLVPIIVHSFHNVLQCLPLSNERIL